MPKRIVLQYTTGQFAGLFQIVGTDDQLKEGLKTTDLPAFVPDVTFLDHQGSANLVQIKPRYALYRELITPAGSMAQQFHPEQQ